MKQLEALALANSILEFINALPRDGETWYELIAHLMEDGITYPESSLARLQEKVTDELAVSEG